MQVCRQPFVDLHSKTRDKEANCVWMSVHVQACSDSLQPCFIHQVIARKQRT